ncbi:MAG: M15 family metallopeptidase [Acidimicrobiales bacterium]
MPPRRIRPTLTALLLVAVGLGACGESAGETAGDPTSTSRATTSSSTTTEPSTTTIETTTTTTTAVPPPAPAAVTTTRPPAPPVTAAPVPAPPFSAAIRTVTADDLYASWRPGCPVHFSQLRAIDVTHFGNDGAVHTGRLIVHATLAQGMVDIFRDLYAARFPIQRMEPVDVYGGDDNRSIKANNTSAFNCRAVTGGTGWSEHAYGRAIDVNPFVNPYLKNGKVLPPEAAPYTDRSRNDPGMIHAGDAVVDAFAARGWSWGGYWSSLKDWQHFSTTGG